MIVNPKGIKCGVMGLQGGGKTFYSKQMIKEYNLRCFVYSPHKEDFASEGDNFIFYSHDYSKESITNFLTLSKSLAQAGHIDVLLIDEFDTLFAGNFDLPPIAKDLFANHRHYNNLGIIGITRRPQDIPAYFIESCKFLVIFALQGETMKKKFNGLWSKLGDAIQNLNYESREFIIKEIGQSPKKYKKLTI